MIRRLLAILGIVFVVGCTPSATPAAATKLVVGLGYLSSVQFAQFYRAQEQGYYSASGLEVTFQNEISPNLVTLVGNGTVDIGIADGTDVIPAVGQGIPIHYAATIYAQFPNAVITAASSGISSPADLAGHTLGIPGRYGSSWIMLQALLASANLTVADIDVREYPDYGQAIAMRQGQVDAATAYRNNESVQLAGDGFATNTLTVDNITPLPGPGLIVGTSTMVDKKDAVRAFVAATLRAMDEIRTNPVLGLDDSIAQVPDLATNRDVQLAVLQATVAMWDSTYTLANGTGTINSDAWSRSLEFMRGLPGSNIPANLTVGDLVTQELLP